MKISIIGIVVQTNLDRNVDRNLIKITFNVHVKFDWDLRLINWEIYANNSYIVVGNNFGNCVEVNLDLFEGD